MYVCVRRKENREIAKMMAVAMAVVLAATTTMVHMSVNGIEARVLNWNERERVNERTSLSNKLQNDSEASRTNKTKTYDCYLPLAIEINIILCYPKVTAPTHFTGTKTARSSLSYQCRSNNNAKYLRYKCAIFSNTCSKQRIAHSKSLFHFLYMPTAMVQALWPIVNPIYWCLAKI